MFQVQLLAYNTDLYSNFTEAMSQPRGLLAVSVIVDVSAQCYSGNLIQFPKHQIHPFEKPAHAQDLSITNEKSLSLIWNRNSKCDFSWVQYQIRSCEN